MYGDAIHLTVLDSAGTAWPGSELWENDIGLLASWLIPTDARAVQVQIEPVLTVTGSGQQIELDPIDTLIEIPATR